jgi:hypothetical protein
MNIVNSSQRWGEATQGEARDLSWIIGGTRVVSCLEFDSDDDQVFGTRILDAVWWSAL